MKSQLRLDQAEEIVRKVIFEYCKLKRLPYKQMASDPDYLSPCIEGLLYADAQWDETKGASLISFRYKGILLALLGARKKEKMKTINYSFNTLVDKKPHFPIDLNKETIEELYKKVPLEDFQKKILELRFYEDKTFIEIGKELKCSKQNAEQCLRRTLEKLKTYVSENNVVL